ncbi:hypothetical protein [Ensifer sp. MJa1]|uniref:hypothetical protein n=1 Tax=Ensifer sp. MJa1 TaxID=2919888 RepID=UPI0030090939
MIAKIVYQVPVFGWMLKEAMQGPQTVKVLFLVNCALIWLLAIVTFGYPAIIIPALALVPVIFILLILITMG